MRILYDIFIQLFKIAIWLASRANPKAKKWLDGRKSTFQELAQFASENKKNIWVHCASVGEFEQGIPLIDKLIIDYPNYKILVSFFSPSGYEYAKKRRKDLSIIYLPIDTSANAKRWISILQPKLAIFVKYEIWHYYFHQLSTSQTPLLLVSAIFWKKLFFFKAYGTFFRKALRQVSYFFVQDEESKRLLHGIGLKNVLVTGDTRFERVIELKNTDYKDSTVEEFIANHNVFIAGSIWGSDVETVMNIIDNLPSNFKVILAPHEIDKFEYAAFGAYKSAYYSEKRIDPTVKILFLNTIGQLSKMYRFATITYIGGGFGKGIHNILEAAVYNKPIIIGPNHERFAEARSLISLGLVQSITNSIEAASVLPKILNLPAPIFSANEYFFKRHSNVSAEIILFIKKHAFLD